MFSYLQFDIMYAPPLRLHIRSLLLVSILLYYKVRPEERFVLLALLPRT